MKSFLCALFGHRLRVVAVRYEPYAYAEVVTKVAHTLRCGCGKRLTHEVWNFDPVTGEPVEEGR